MPFSFPASPTVGQQSTQNGRLYQWTGSAWELASVPDAIASTNISDATAAGRAILTAADAAAQRTSLGLGSMATATATDYATAIPSVSSPASLSSNTNNWNPTVADIVRVSSSAAVSITGIAAPSANLVFVLVNVGSFAITLSHQNTGSTEQNRLLSFTGQDVVLSANCPATLWYDTASQRWRVL